MSEALKQRLRRDCAGGKHVAPFDDGDCWGCSSAHVEEFGGGCVGVLDCPTKYDTGFGGVNCGPEWDVRWFPEMMRFAYALEDLELVTKPSVT